MRQLSYWKDKNYYLKGYHFLSLKKYVVSLVVFCLANLLSLSVATANPVDGQVSAGDATISAPNSTTVHIQQNSDKAVIDWRSFNIAPNETTKFSQPGKSSVTLNRINPLYGVSTIAGKLQANGRIFLVNPAGVVFGATARVDVAGLLVTTANITNEDFMTGNYRFVQSPDWNGKIINYGDITIADAGLAALVAPGVENHGLIQANLGTVVMASGNQFTVDFYGDNIIHFALGGDGVKTQPAVEAVSNNGRIVANGGTVLLSAKTAGNVLDKVINMSGSIEAKAAVQKGGSIILLAESGTVSVSGTLDASAKVADGKGGTIKVLGKKVEVKENAKIDASGDAGGGEILLGGDYQGKNPAILNADQTYVAPNTMITADAISEGNGGKVIVWANQDTLFEGNIFARGGELFGDGGFVEVSGKENLIYQGYVNTLSPNGQAGTLLLDPKFLIIKKAGGSDYDGSNNLFSDNASGTNTLTPDSIDTAAETSNIILQANTDITFESTLTINNTGTSGRTLTVQAGRSIQINADITTNDGSIFMTANDVNADASNRDSGAGGITMASNTTLNAGTANITLTVGSTNTGGFTPGDINLRELIVTGVGSTVTVTTPGSITLNADVSTPTASGNVVLTAGDAITQGSVTLTGLNLTAKTLNDSGAEIILTDASNNFTTVDLRSRNATDSANAAGAISYRDINAVDIAAANTTSTVTLTAGGAITQSGSMTGTTLTAKTLINGGAEISLNNPGNEFASVDLSSRNANDSNNAAGAITYQDATGFDIPSTIATTSTITLTAGGAITQTGGAGIFGTTLTVKTLNDSGADITLDNPLNELTTINLQARNLTDTANAAGAISYYDADAVEISGINTDSTLDLTAGGTITQTGALTVADTATFTLTTATTDLLLGSFENDFSNSPVITSNGNIRDLSLRNINSGAMLSTLPTGLRNVAFEFDNASISLPSITLTGTLTLTSYGPITQTGTIAGTTLTAKTKNDGGSAITLEDASNAFTTVDLRARNSADTANASGVISYRDLNAVSVAAANTLSTVNLIAGGAITQTGSMTGTTLTAKTLSSGTADITLNITAGNEFQNIDLRARNATDTVNAAGSLNYRDATGFTVNKAASTGAITLIGGDAIAQASGVDTGIMGSTLTVKTLNNAGSSITLNNTENDVTTIDLRARNAADSSNAAGSLYYQDLNAVVVAAANTTSTIDLIAGDEITQSGAMAGTTLMAKTLKTGGAAITLNNASNALTTIYLQSRNSTDTATDSGALTYRDANTIDIGAIDTTSTASITATEITQSGAITADTLFAKTLNNLGGAITLNTVANNVNNIDLRARTANDNSNDSGVINYEGAGNFNVSSIATTSSINLTSGGAITDSGNITGSTLTINSIGGAILDFGHNVTEFNATNTGSGLVELVNTGNLSIASVINLVGNFVLQNSGTTTINGTINTGGNNVQLTSTSAVTDGTLGSITANQLTVKTLRNSGSDITLDNINSHDVNVVDFRTRNALDTTNEAGVITFVDITGFDVAQINTTSTVTLEAGDALTQSGLMTGSTLTVTTVGGITFNNANLIDAINLTNSNSGDLTFTGNTIPLTIEGISQSGGGAVTIGNTGNTTIADNASFLTNGSTVAINIAAGTFALGNSATLNSQNANINLTATDLDLASGSSLNAGSGTVSITQNTPNGSIGLGDTAGTMHITGAELENITANILTLNAPNDGSIIVDNISAEQSANINSVILTATTGTLGAVTFQNNASTFKALTVDAADGILINAPVITTQGILSMDADVDNAAALNDVLQLNSDLTAAGSVTLNATTGGIVLGGPVSISGNGITFNDTLNGSHNLTLNAGSSGDITFNADVGNTLRLGSLTIINMNNLINLGLLSATNYLQNTGNLTSFGTSLGLDLTGNATIVGNNVTGKVTVLGLSLETNFANLIGSVDNATGQDAIDKIILLNTITAGTHFFDGIDMYGPPTSPIPPTPPPFPVPEYLIPQVVSISTILSDTNFVEAYPVEVSVSLNALSTLIDTKRCVSLTQEIVLCPNKDLLAH